MFLNSRKWHYFFWDKSSFENGTKLVPKLVIYSGFMMKRYVGLYFKSQTINPGGKEHEYVVPITYGFIT